MAIMTGIGFILHVRGVDSNASLTLFGSFIDGPIVDELV